MTTFDPQSELPPPVVLEALIDSDWVTEPTREAFKAKLAGPKDQPPGCLNDRAFAVLKAAVARLVPQTGTASVPIAEIITANLTYDRRDGWRFAQMPPDEVAYRLGLQGLDETARCLFAEGFIELGPVDQEAVLGSIQDGWSPSLIWEQLSPTLFFQDLLAEAVEVFAAHPVGQEWMGFRGMADAQGFSGIGLDQRDPVDLESTHASI